jgi:hypothetical protein
MDSNQPRIHIGIVRLHFVDVPAGRRRHRKDFNIRHGAADGLEPGCRLDAIEMARIFALAGDLIADRATGKSELTNAFHVDAEIGERGSAVFGHVIPSA